MRLLNYGKTHVEEFLMGTSFVEYKEYGYWTRDSFLETWLTTLLEEMRKLPELEPWQKSLMEHWQVQATVDGGCMALGLDKFLLDASRLRFVLSLARRALQLSKPVGRRTGELFVELLEGKLNTTVSSPIDYL
jgi:hypothetical protein